VFKAGNGPFSGVIIFKNKQLLRSDPKICFSSGVIISISLRTFFMELCAYLKQLFLNVFTEPTWLCLIFYLKI